MIWGESDEARRVTLAGVVAVILFAAVMLLAAVHVQAGDPQATAYIECGNDGCQIDIVKPGCEPQEYFVRYVVYREVRQ